MDGCILPKSAQINHWEMEKNCSDFGHLDLIFNVTGGQRMFKNAFFIVSPEEIG